MTDLMKPRVKVIADYPNSPFEIGDILWLGGVHPAYFGANGKVLAEDAERCTAIFAPPPVVCRADSRGYARVCEMGR